LRAGSQGKELYCVSRETGNDGSMLFKFSEEKPKEEKPKEEEVAVEEKVEEVEPKAMTTTKKKPKGFGGAKRASKSKVQPIVIVGAGRVGQALAEMGNGVDLVLKRGDKFPSDLEGRCPIVVCTRNDVLEDVVYGIPPGRWEDLVFLQNGVLQPWLEKMGLQNCSQMLAYFAVARAGEKPTDGKTELNPEGLTSITGKWAEEVAERLHLSDLSCHVLNKEDYDVRMYEKLIWISSFMIVGASNGGCTVGAVCDNHRDQLAEVINELAGVISSNYGCNFPPALVDRLVAYGRSVAHFPTAVKELPWRNGFFYDISQNALKSGAQDPAPLHTKMLEALNVLA